MPRRGVSNSLASLNRHIAAGIRAANASRRLLSSGRFQPRLVAPGESSSRESSHWPADAPLGSQWPMVFGPRADIGMSASWKSSMAEVVDIPQGMARSVQRPSGRETPACVLDPGCPSHALQRQTNRVLDMFAPVAQPDRSFLPEAVRRQKLTFS